MAKLLKYRHDLGGQLRVKIARRLTGQDDAGPIN